MQSSGSTNSKDFSTISPSALSLLYLKSLTHIPYAREAAEVMKASANNQFNIQGQEFGFWARVLHFENRYWSIDQLLYDLPIKNIIELSSGFSLRGLEAIKQNDVHYIDTDLPEVIESKRKLIEAIEHDCLKGMNSQLQLMPLNALDEKQFNEAISHLPPGPIAIVNEGLLMYLNTEEKQQLCRIIHQILKQRGGYWITADIYIKRQSQGIKPFMNDQLQQFFEQHKIEENKFDSMEAATAFFKDNGLILDKEAQPDYTKLTVLPNLMKHASSEQLERIKKAGRMQFTWRLKISD